VNYNAYAALLRIERLSIFLSVQSLKHKRSR